MEIPKPIKIEFLLLILFLYELSISSFFNLSAVIPNQIKIQLPVINNIDCAVWEVKNVLTPKKINNKIKKFPMKSPIEIEIPDQKFLVKTLLTISKKIGPGIAEIEKPINILSKKPILILDLFNL